jgi:hypothetical protein
MDAAKAGNMNTFYKGAPPYDNRKLAETDKNGSVMRYEYDGCGGLSKGNAGGD